MTEAELVEQWLPLAKMYAGRARKDLPWEDRISAAMEGLLYGVRTYLSLDCPEYALGTYIQYRLRREVGHAASRHERQYVPPTLGATGDGGGWAVPTADTYDLGLPPVGGAQEQQVAGLLAAGLTQADVARTLGVSRQRVGQIVAVIRRNLEGSSSRNDGGGE